MVNFGMANDGELRFEDGTTPRRENGMTRGDMACRICGGTEIRPFRAREMMFGTRQEFVYFECLHCGCVQIDAYPSDTVIYYPPNYYAHIVPDQSEIASPMASLRSAVKTRLLKSPALWALWMNSPSTKRWLSGQSQVSLYTRYLQRNDARILDVGCGRGELVEKLRSIGYSAALGAEPFIASDIKHHGQILVKKSFLQDMNGAYDCISFHHSLEHMPDQRGILEKARMLLAPGGIVIVRIPIVGGEAWRKYQENWVQLDAPRHFYLHSKRSLEILVQSAGLRIRELSWDSNSFQFWGSELYLRDIPLNASENGPLFNEMELRRSSLFSDDQLARYRQHATDLNDIGEGDQVVAVLEA